MLQIILSKKNSAKGSGTRLGNLLHFVETFQSLWQNLFTHIFRQFFIFLVKSFLGNFYRNLVIFFWSHWQKVQILLSRFIVVQPILDGLSMQEMLEKYLLLTSSLVQMPKAISRAFSMFHRRSSPLCYVAVQ